MPLEDGITLSRVRWSALHYARHAPAHLMVSEAQRWADFLTDGAALLTNGRYQIDEDAFEERERAAGAACDLDCADRVAVARSLLSFLRTGRE